jgi:hypothetical protein
MIKWTKFNFLKDPKSWRKIAASFLFLTTAFAFSGHADAHTLRHHHHQHYYHHRYHHHRYNRHHHWRRHREVWHHHPMHHRYHADRYDWRHRHSVYAVQKTDQRRWRATVSEGRSSVLAVASRFVGDSNPTGFRGPWCKAFVNMVARKTGHFTNASLRAVDALHMGVRVRSPRPGDVAVMRSHTTFFAGYGGRGFLGLGGNQSHHRVTVSSYPLARVIAWIRLQ